MDENDTGTSFGVHAAGFIIGFLLNAAASLFIDNYSWEYMLLSLVLVFGGAGIMTLLKSPKPTLRRIQDFTYGAGFGTLVVILPVLIFFSDYQPPPRLAEPTIPSTSESDSSAYEGTPPPSATATPSSPSPTPGTGVVEPLYLITALVSMNIRFLPHHKAAIAWALRAGESARVKGITSDHSWWQIECPNDPSLICWISAQPQYTYLSVGNINEIPIVANPIGDNPDWPIIIPTEAPSHAAPPTGGQSNPTAIPPTNLPTAVPPTVVVATSTPTPIITPNIPTPTATTTSTQPAQPCNRDNQPGGVRCTPTSRATQTPVATNTPPRATQPPRATETPKPPRTPQP